MRQTLSNLCQHPMAQYLSQNLHNKRPAINKAYG